MPELPDVTVYIERLQAKCAGQPLLDLRIKSPFLLRSVDPPVADILGKTVSGFRRLGKRIIFEFEDELFMVLHLMIAGRIRWRKVGAKPPGKNGLAAFDFPDGTLILTEASSHKRASLHLVRGASGLGFFDRGGLELFGASLEQFTEAITRENHTMKRTLTDPRLLSGIGNAYSDEILHHARMSPMKLSTKLSDDEIARLFDSCKHVLTLWTSRLREETGDGFPDKVTAFREGMAAHGRYKEPCPVCATPIQRIRYAKNETNYCPECQTGGKLLADRALSRLLKKDWPKSLDELEEMKAVRRI